MKKRDFSEDGWNLIYAFSAVLILLATGLALVLTAVLIKLLLSLL